MKQLDDLVFCLNNQCELLQKFIVTLESENTMLLDSPTNESIIGHTTLKNDFAQRLAEIDSKRAQLLGELGFEDTPAGIDTAIQQYPDLAFSFDSLWSLVEQAATINSENGGIITTFMEHNQKAMDSLQAIIGMEFYNSSGTFKK